MNHGLSPREYQERIFETCRKKNCLVVLPTGMGKTLIALMLARERFERFPQSKILFLAPTRPLAAQHLEYFRKNLPELYADMQLFTGKVQSRKREELWQRADIIFSTPQCIANDLRNNRINLKEVSLMIEDESHRCLKNYDYVFIAQTYLKEAINPRILGLTASPGADASIIEEICKNLRIEAVEVRTRESSDVKPYLQELKTEVVRIDLPEEFERIRDILKDIYKKRIEELKNRRLLFAPPTKKNILELQHRIMSAIASGERHFNILRGASVCAQAIKMQHAIEMIETQGTNQLYNYMKELFDQAAKGKSKAVQQLVKQQDFNIAYTSVSELVNNKIDHPKIAKLKEIVEREFKEKPKSRIIVFSHFRETVTNICKMLNSIDGVNARVFVGQARREEGGLTQREQQAIIEDFRRGIVNILVATSIGEEGLDLPEVNCVIFYEPVPSAIRKIQRTGRTARLMPGKLIMLITRKTHDEAYHWAAVAKERKMHGILNNINEHLQEKKKQLNLDKF